MKRQEEDREQRGDGQLDSVFHSCSDLESRSVVRSMEIARGAL
jgi:hypothetical protein